MISSTTAPPGAVRPWTQVAMASFQWDGVDPKGLRDPENSHALLGLFLRDNDGSLTPQKNMAGLTFLGGLVMITAIFLGGGIALGGAFRFPDK